MVKKNPKQKESVKPPPKIKHAVKNEAFPGFRDFIDLGARGVNDFGYRAFLLSLPVELAKNLLQLFRLDD